MTFSWYGFLLGVSFLLFWYFFEKALSSRHSKIGSKLDRAIFLTALGAVIGARAYHVITAWPLYQGQPWWTLLAVWEGGLGIFGALLGGLIGLFVWKRTYHPAVGWSEMSDSAALALPLAQTLGRWGNFVNQELFGKPSTLPWAIPIDPQHRPELWQEFATFHPLFLYESLFSLSLGLFLWFMFTKHGKTLPLGSRFYTSYYFIGYGSVRFSLEMFRYPSPLTLGLTSGQWSSLLIVAIGLLVFPRVLPLQWKQHVS